MINTLQHTLGIKERELALLLAIDDMRDKIRDNTPPVLNYQKLLTLLMQHFEADAGALVVNGEQADDPAYRVAVKLKDEDIAPLCQPLCEAINAEPIRLMTVPNHWGQGMGIQIIMDNVLLGGIMLVRERGKHPFDNDDLAVLKTAESQLDSAIVQVRRMWKLVQRNRELDAIYQLDTLRDSDSDETKLISGFMQVVTSQLEAELCMVILSHIDTGELVVRELTDKLGLTPEELQQITAIAGRTSSTGALAVPRPGIHLLASPFIVADMQLGAVVVGRKTTFYPDDHRLLKAMSSQMDSAVVYSRVITQLSQRNKELEIIYEIDRIRDSNLDFGAMLQAVLGELCRGINADLGYILLYSDEKEEQLEIKSLTDEVVLTSSAYYKAIHAISRKALDSAAMCYENEGTGEVRSIIAVPLILRDKIIGVFGGVNSRSVRGFNAEDRRILNAIVSQTDTAVFERIEQRRVRQVLGRSVDPKVLDHLLKHANAATILQGERMVISVLFADIRGSTEWAERTQPDALAYALNAYLGRMTDVIFEFGGTLDKFVGDEVIGLFGAPIAMPNHAEQCAAAAMRMQEVMAELIAEMQAVGYELPPMGVGVSTGDVICGEFGTAQRTDYTAMGRMMNLGARLCSAAKGGEVVISEVTYEAVKDHAEVEPLESVTAKGIGQVKAYKLKILGTTS